MKKWKKALIIVVCVIGALAVIAGVVAGSCALFGLAVEDDFTFTAYDGSKGGDRIHFLNVGNSDAIFLESDGKFALVDCGEDNDNPRGFDGLDLTGYEDYVVDYLNGYCADENGQIYQTRIIRTWFKAANFRSYCVKCLDNMSNITCGICLVSTKICLLKTACTLRR